jgi:type VI secretion system FHA domain protein
MLTVNVTTLNGQALTQPICADFGETGGTIGRSPENTLVLTDPDRKISRTHATVAFRDGVYTLRDQGSVVPVLVNGRPLGNGNESPLADGDEIRISGYAMRVAGAAVAAQAVPAAAPPDAMPEPVLSWAGDAPAAPGEGIRTVVLSTPEPAPARPAATAAPAAPAASAPMAAATAPAAAPTVAASTATHDELLRALLAGAGLRDVEIPGGLSPQLMNQLGSLLHEATRGLIDLLAARASAKRQARADMTVIVTKDNNPLKFSPNVETALAQLLVPRGRGFMPPLRAVGDAYEDLRMHQQGFMAGMRSALAQILARFDPSELEQRLSDHSMVNSILPTTRKAKLWDMFGQLYGQISKEAESDVHALFGEEFLRAYQAHVGKPPERGETAPRK